MKINTPERQNNKQTNRNKITKKNQRISWENICQYRDIEVNS